MKKERTLLLVLLFAAGQAVAQQKANTQLATQVTAASASQTNHAASATFTASKPKFHIFGPAKPVQSQKVLRIEGLDPRAWTTVAETSTSREAFPNGHTHQAGLCLLWWGAESRTQR
jgi:hypothetical protein